MAEIEGNDRELEEARSALERGDWQGASRLYQEAASRGPVPEGQLLPAATALLKGGSEPAALELAEALLGRVDAGDPRHDEAVRLRAEVLEERNGRSPRDAAARAVAHMSAAILGGGSRSERHLRGMFRALIRVAELEGTFPALDPRLPGAPALAEALEGHKRWRRGGPARAAAEGYRKALEAGPPAALEPYLLYWEGHLLSVAGDREGALATLRHLLEVGPPGANGVQDVEARIRRLEEQLEASDLADVRTRVEELRSQGKGREAVELLQSAIHRGQDPAEVLELRKLLARVLTVLGERDAAKAEWEAIQRAQDEGPEPDDERDSDPEPVSGEVLVDPPEAEAGGTEPPGPPPERAPEEERQVQVVTRFERPPTTEITVVDGNDGLRERARHHAALARRLDEAGQALEAVHELRRAYLALPRGYEQETLRKRAAAMAWHRLGDPVLALEALAGLPAEVRSAPDTARLEEDLRSGVVERLKKEIDLGLRTEAFRALSRLHNALDAEKDGGLREALFELYLAELASCVYRRLALRRDELREVLKGYDERGLGAWNLVKLPGDAEGSARHLATLREEAVLLERFAESLEARERAVVEGEDAEGHARRLEDRGGLMAMEAILVFVAEVASRRATRGAEKPVADWRDRLVSWLPEGARELLQSPEARSVDGALADLQGQFEAFLDLRF